MKGRLLSRVEFWLIILMVLACVLIAQQWSFALYQIGLLTIIGATILSIAVGNVPHASRGWRAFGSIVIILAVTVALFAVGIELVPYLAHLGQ